MKNLLLLAGYAVWTTAGAQESPLTIREAVELAMRHSPVIESSEAGRDAARAKTAEAASGRLPKVNYSESWTRSNNPVFVFSSLLTQRQFTQQNFALDALNRPDFLNNFQSRITAEQTVFDAGATRRATGVAKRGVAMSDETIRARRMQVTALVAKSYYDSLLAAEQMEVSASAIRSAEADLERAMARRDAGFATDADVLSIRVHLAKAREENIHRKADRETANATLNQAIGLPLDTPHTLASTLTERPVAAVDSTGERPELRQAKLAIEIRKLATDSARSAMLPQVAVTGAFESDRQRFYNRAGQNWLVSASLRWNLFNGFADRARIQEAEAAQRGANADAAQAKSQILLEIHQAAAARNAAIERIATARAAVEEAKESLRIFQDRYGEGLVTVSDLLRAETAMIEARSLHAAALHSERVAAVALAFAYGTLNAGSEVLN
ncbi:MAG TPA: TolC family protein [Bryobacteraceae bacterium]|nr:TolC family protein [Bryobacteraceae bacterium]